MKWAGVRYSQRSFNVSTPNDGVPFTLPIKPFLSSIFISIFTTILPNYAYLGGGTDHEDNQGCLQWIALRVSPHLVGRDLREVATQGTLAVDVVGPSVYVVLCMAKRTCRYSRPGIFHRPPPLTHPTLGSGEMRREGRREVPRLLKRSVLSFFFFI